MQKLNITQAAKEKGCTRQTMHHLINNHRVNTVVQDRKQLVLIDEKFRNLVLKQISGRQNNEQRIDTIENELALLKEAQKTMQAEMEALKKQLNGKQEKKATHPATRPETSSRIKDGQMVLGFKVIKKTVRGSQQYQAYKRLDGRQCYVYLCPEADLITVQEAQSKIEAYLARQAKATEKT